MTIEKLLRTAEEQCERAGMDIHPARLLLMDVLQVESYQLFAQMPDEVTEEHAEAFAALLHKYTEEKIPVQYILGYEYFAGRNLFVDAGALIPRPETEELVYEVLFKIDAHFPESTYETISMADIGTGSGAIAVSLAAEEPRIQMIATDISEEALEVAKKNAKTYAETVTFAVGDMLQPLIDQGIQLDFLVSNPPYIPVDEDVQEIVKENEPHVALFGGNDGLFFYKKILSNAAKILKPRNMLAFEIGYDQAERLMAFAQECFPEATIYVKKDMQGKDRMLFIENNL